MFFHLLPPFCFTIFPKVSSDGDILKTQEHKTIWNLCSFHVRPLVSGVVCVMQYVHAPRHFVSPSGESCFPVYMKMSTLEQLSRKVSLSGGESVAVSTDRWNATQVFVLVSLPETHNRLVEVAVARVVKWTPCGHRLGQTWNVMRLKWPKITASVSDVLCIAFFKTQLGPRRRTIQR